MAIDFNATNYSAWTSIWLQPYIHIFGDMFFALLLLVIAAGIYVGSDKNTFLTAIYCFVIAVIFGPILNFYVSAFILFIAGLVFSSITYNAIIEKKQR